jgi:type IV secretion system protein VirB5
MTKLFNRHPEIPEINEDLSTEVNDPANVVRDLGAMGKERLLPRGDNPTEVYLRGRQEWDDRLGDIASQRDSWKKIAFAAVGGIFLLSGGCVYLGSLSKVVVVPVERDQNLDVVAVRTVGTRPVADPAYVAADLKRWIRNVRTVYTDTNALRKGIIDGYMMISNGSPANQLLDDFYNKEDAFERAKKQTVKITPLSAIPNSDNTPDGEGRVTWRLEWQEDVSKRDGTLFSSDVWVATVTFIINDPTTSEQVEANPTGIYITNINWSKKSA